MFSPGGELEVSLSFDNEGPVVKIRCARLELSSPESVSVDCQRFALHTRESTRLTSGGNITLDGENIFLNCLEPEQPNGPATPVRR